MLNPTAGNLGRKAGLVPECEALVMTVCIFPPSGINGRRYEELDLLFRKRVSAGHLKDYVLEEFEELDSTNMKHKV